MIGGTRAPGVCPPWQRARKSRRGGAAGARLLRGAGTACTTARARPARRRKWATAVSSALAGRFIGVRRPRRSQAGMAQRAWAAPQMRFFLWLAALGVRGVLGSVGLPVQVAVFNPRGGLKHRAEGTDDEHAKLQLYCCCPARGRATQARRPAKICKYLSSSTGLYLTSEFLGYGYGYGPFFFHVLLGPPGGGKQLQYTGYGCLSWISLRALLLRTVTIS